jgi:hypothetical protein
MPILIRLPRLAGLALLLAPVFAPVLGGAQPAEAAEPAAIVEDVEGAIKDVQPFDYLVPGTQLQLPPRTTLVIGYLKSCAHETITGGKVLIGTEQSTVDGGQLLRETVECDGGHMQLTANQAAKSGVMVFRGTPRPAPAAQPQLTVYGVSPIFTLAGADRLEITRLDQAGQPPLDFPVARAKAGRSTALDLAKQNIALAPGGVYQASGGAHSVVFKIDALAKPGAAPAVGRLVRIE